MYGSIINSLTIIFGGLIGLMLKKGISQRYQETIMDGLALVVITIGIINAVESKNIILVISSLVIGSIIGEKVRIDKRLNNLGGYLESKFKKEGSTFTEGFVSATLVFCVGAMAIVGSLEAGLLSDYNTLIVKSMLDGITSMIFATALGIGVLFSSLPVLIYQGSITLLASSLSSVLTTVVITEVSAVGGILIMAIGLSLLKVKEIRVANMIPAVLIPVIYYFIISLIA